MTRRQGVKEQKAKIARMGLAPGTPDPAILKGVRARLANAEEELRLACRLLRENGWPENAGSLTIELKRLLIWTQPAGWFDQLEKGKTE